MRGLPVGWSQCTLQDVGEIVTGNTPPKINIENYGDRYPWVKPPDLGSNIPIITTAEKLSEEGAQMARLVPKGATLVSCIGILGKVGISGATLATNQQINSVVFNSSLVVPQYGFFYCKTLKPWLDENSSSTTVAIINKRRFSEAPFVLAPLNEQGRIIAKLEKILSRVNAAQERLATIPHILKRFRQSVLAAACSGELTADWRKKTNVAKTTKLERIEDVANYLGGFAYRSSTFTADGTNQVIRIGNVRPLTLRLDASPVFIPNEIAEISSRFQLQQNDLVISMTGTKYKKDYGYAALVPQTDKKLYLNQRVSRLKCGPKILPRFLLYWLQTDFFRDFFFEGETGNVNQGNIGVDGIRKAPIELPSLLEQEEIVRRVETLFKTADELEARYLKAKAHVDKLTQSILAKAFRGELVPQDPNDEPASVLLERIIGERNGSAVKRRSRK